jgi:peptidoglycan/xylan/chitin deacetylase (PgdA/CDA1 family)
MAKGCGVFRIVRDSKWRSQRLLILGYHGISIDDEHEWDPELFMPQSLLLERLKTLKAGSYAVLPFEEAIERLYAGDLPPRAVTLTFDDGFHDFRTRACPVLSDFGFPATVYLTTYYVEHRYPIFNVLFSYLLWKGRQKTLNLCGLVPGEHEISLASQSERSAVRERILGHVAKESLNNEQKESFAIELAHRIGVDHNHIREKGILYLMAPSEVSELSQFGVTVQLHTHRHRTPDDEALFRREIHDNRDAITRTAPTSTELNHFCYPSGYYKPKFFRWLEMEKIVSATTCKPGIASRESARFELPRLIDTCSLPSVAFEGWLTGMSHHLPQRS